MKIKSSVFAMVLALSLSGFGLCQESKSVAESKNGVADKTSSKEKKEKNLSDASKAFKEIQKLITEGKWTEAGKKMTDKASNELAIEQVVSAAGLSKMDVQIPIPGIEDAIDELEDVMIRHGLDKLEIDTSKSFKMSFSMDGEDEESEEEFGKATKDIADQSEKILSFLKNSGKRWEIVKDLWDAKKASPFSMSPFNGKIQEEEIEGETAFLKVEMAGSKSDDGSGVVVQMMSPPVVMKMIKDGDRWKLDGRDQEKTMKLMKEFMANPRQIPPTSNRQDF